MKNPDLRKLLALSFVSFVITLSMTEIFSYLVRSFNWYLYLAISSLVVAIRCGWPQAFRNKTMLAALCIGLSTFTYLKFLTSPVSSWASLYQAVAMELRKQPTDVRVASWAVGHIGFFSQVPTINLEGIISDHRVFEANQHGTLPQLMNQLQVNRIVYNDKLPHTIVNNAPFFVRLRLQPILTMKPCLRTIFDQSSKTDEIHLFILDSECLYSTLSELKLIQQEH